MKIAISTAGHNLDAQVELKFGRANSFLIFDTESETIKLINQDQLRQYDT